MMIKANRGLQVRLGWPQGKQVDALLTCAVVHTIIFGILKFVALGL